MVTLRRPRTREGAGFQLAILAGVVVYLLISVIGDYTQASVHPEVTRYFLPAAISTGRAWHWEDFGQAFNWELLDHLPRTRFLYYLAFVANAKLRLGLIQSTVLPPAFSFTWLFSLVFAPGLVYRLVMSLTGSRRGSLAAATVYLCSPGTLSSAVLLFHPGKPMVVFVIVGCLVWAFEVARRSQRPGSSSRALRISTWLLPGAMFLGMFCDESAWFVLIAVPLLFPSLLRSRGNGPHPLLLYALVPVCFLGFTILLAPFIVQRLGYHRFDMLGYLWAPTLNPRGVGQVLVASGLNIFGDHLVPPWLTDAGPYRTPAAVAALGGGALWVRWLMAGEAQPRRRVLGQAIAACIGCAAYQGMLAYKHPGVIDHCYYYASSFAPFFAICVGSLVASSRCTGAVSAAVTLWIAGVSLGNFHSINLSRIADGQAVWADMFPKEAEYMAPARPLSRDEMVRLWKLRDSRAELEAAARSFPISALWWVAELRALGDTPP